GIRDGHVTGVQTCALPISAREPGIHSHNPLDYAAAFAYCLLRGYGFRARGLRPRPGMTEENMLSIVCVSPVDGREVVRRAASSRSEERRVGKEWRVRVLMS